MLLRSEIRRVQEVVRRYFSDKTTTDTRLDAVEGTAVTLQESISELQSSDSVDLTDYYTKAEVDAALAGVGGEFAGDMDDIPDGSTYVKTHNDLTSALISLWNSKLSAIDKAMVEAVLTGSISTHSHAGGNTPTSWGKYF